MEEEALAFVIAELLQQHEDNDKLRDWGVDWLV